MVSKEIKILNILLNNLKNNHMRIFIYIIVFYCTLQTCLSQTMDIPQSSAYEYFKAFVRIQQGKVAYEHEDFDFFSNKKIDAYGLKVYEFHYMDLFSMKEKLLVEVINNHRLYDDSLLMNHLESFGMREKNVLLDSLLKQYLRISSQDSLIHKYRQGFEKIDFYQNNNSSCIFIGIVAYSPKNDAFYDLLGFKYNDFAIFLNNELLTQASWERYRNNEKSLKKELKSLKLFEIDLGLYYDYYVKSKNLKERYPIKFKMNAL
jgi:hypothetical protein